MPEVSLSLKTISYCFPFSLNKTQFHRVHSHKRLRYTKMSLLYSLHPLPRKFNDILHGSVTYRTTQKKSLEKLHWHLLAIAFAVHPIEDILVERGRRSVPPECRDSYGEYVCRLCHIIQADVSNPLILSERLYKNVHLHVAKLDRRLHRLRIPCCSRIIIPIQDDKTIAVPIGGVDTSSHVSANDQSPVELPP